MARAMRGLGPWKPKAMRVRRRIFVLVDSIAARWSTILRCSTKAGSLERRAQLIQASRALAFFAFEVDRVTQPLFEQVGSPESGVRTGDPLELVVLADREVVLPARALPADVRE